MVRKSHGEQLLCYLVISLSLLMAPCFSAFGGQSNSVRIATFNLNCGNRSWGQILEAIKMSNADILLLQETTIESERFLQSRLQASYPYFYATGYQGLIPAERLAFVSRFPLREVRFFPPDKGLFGFYSAICDIAKTPVKLVNVHLTPFVVRPNAGFIEILTAVNDAEGKHAAEIQSICTNIDIHQPTIMAGDFNSLSTFAAPTQLRKMGLIDSFAASHADANSYPTWHAETRLGSLGLRLDYIFHTSDFHSIDSEIIKRGGSDHFLLVSKLQPVKVNGRPNKSLPIQSQTNQTAAPPGGN